MPIKSDAMRRAMYAAAAGKSTLGIPPSVGKEFVAAGPASASLPNVAPKPGTRIGNKSYGGQPFGGFIRRGR